MQKIPLTMEKVREWLELEEEEFYIDKFRERHKILPSSSNLGVHFNRLVAKGTLKRLGERGLYRKVRLVQPIDWMSAEDDVELPFNWFTSHADSTDFGLNGLISIAPGDLIVFAGVSNAGKSALVKNLLAENLSLFPTKPVLMGNEYTVAIEEGDKPSPKFKRSLMAMDWVTWANGNGSKFDLLPVRGDYEDHIVKDTLNIIDWINLTGEFWAIGKVMENIKKKVGQGVAVVCLQKDKEKELGRGGAFTHDMADAYFSVDILKQGESRLTVGKVKEAKGMVVGKSWSFKISNHGSTISSIYEVERCLKCKASGLVWDRQLQQQMRCGDCAGVGWLRSYRGE